MQKLHRQARARIWSGLLLAACVAPAPALAAPFCVRTQALPPQCIYTDPSICQRDANQQGGVCAANAEEANLRPGIGQYCLVTPSLVSQCIYPDRNSCESEARRHNGACVAAPRLAPYGAPDPYAAIGGK